MVQKNKKIKSIKPIRGGGVFLCFDFAALEVRAFTNIAREHELGKIIQSGLDMHSSIAKKVFVEQLKDVPLDKIKSDFKQLRSYSKCATFATLYGSSEFNLADQLNIPVEQAKDIIDGLLNGFPGLKQYMDKCHREAISTGYKDTYFGYRRQLDSIITQFTKYDRDGNIDIGASREAAKKAGFGLRYKHALNASQNHETQSTASIVGWIVATHIQEEFIMQGLKTRVIGNVHDSVEMDVYPGELQDVLRICNYHAKVIPNAIYDWMDLVELDFDFELGVAWLGDECKKVIYNEDDTTNIIWIGGDLHWKWLKEQLDLGYDITVISEEEGKEIEYDEKNPLPQSKKELKVEFRINNKATIKEFKSKYYVGNGKLDSKIELPEPVSHKL